MQIRPLEDGDLPTILTLNQSALEGVGSLDSARLERLLSWADQALLAHTDDGTIAGFVITVAPGTAYDSLNYRWFGQQLGDGFTYLDRIVVSAQHRRMGVASLLYDQIEAALPVALEIYDDNAVSLAFHAARGYRPTGQLEHGGHRNVMLVRAPD